MKNTIKSVPIIYRILFPCVTLFRRGRNVLYRKQQQRELKRFRTYCSYLPSKVPHPLFVKVGANDGTTGDPCSDILISIATWRGLLIEPVPYLYDRLSATFHDTTRFSLQQVAVGESSGHATFYFVDAKARDSIPGLPIWFDQLGSFDKNHILKHLSGVLEPFIVECQVDVRPMARILAEQNIKAVHLLHVDTEGYDYDVLASLDFSACTPVAIFIEHKHLPGNKKAQMLHLLRMHGYRVGDCGGDYFALNKKAYKHLRAESRTSS